MFRRKNVSYSLRKATSAARMPFLVVGLTKWAPILSLALLLYANPVSAVPPVVILDAALTRVSDGTTPFATIDPNGANGEVATLDSANYTFDVNVDRNDGQTHNINNWTIVGTLTTAPSSTGVRWQVGSLPSVCGTKTVSADGRTITCILSGTYPTGTTQNISAAWFATSAVPNGTDVTVDFTVSADMIADSSGADNPVDVTSNQDTLNVVSQASDYEVRKTAGTVSILRDANSDAEFVQVDWGVQVEVKSPEANQVKGISTAALGDLSMSDLVATGDVTQQPVQQDGELVSCIDVPSTSLPNLSYSRSNTMGDQSSVQDSGSWSCSQAGGVGTDINISASGIKWAPDWFTMGRPTHRLQYWAFNSGTTNDTYDSPVGQNNQAVVATQVVRMKYPYATVVAFDGAAGDRDARTNFIEWCNDIGNADVVGANDDVDTSENNQNCALFQNTTGISNSTSKRFTKYQGVSGTGPESELGLTEGALNTGASDNYIVPEQRFGQVQVVSVLSTSVNGMDNWTSCDALDQTKYKLIAHAAPTAPGGSTGAAHSWYSWYMTGTPDASFPVIDDADVVVEFSSTGGSWANSTAQRTTDCDDPSLSWVSDPSTHPNGLAEVNLVRIKILKKVPPGVTLFTYQSIKAEAGLAEDTRLFNFIQYKTSTLASGAWNTANSSCVPENSVWNAFSGNYGCANLADRAIVILPTAIIQKYDTSPTVDGTASVTLGATWTYNIKAGMAYNTDISVTGVHVYDVLPPGLEYVSSTITPTQSIADCNAVSNFACITNANLRTDYGYRTLVWDRGDASFDHTGSAETPTQDYDLFGFWQVTTRISSFIPNAAQLQNKAWVTADGGLQNISGTIPFRTSPGNHNDTTSGPYDDDWVQIATAQGFQIAKYDSQEEIPLNGTLGYTLAFGNLFGSAKVMDGIDIFPYNGDGRFPSSNFDGGFSLSQAIQSFSVVANAAPSNLISKIYVTSADPTTLSDDPLYGNDSGESDTQKINPTPGTGKWTCEYSQIGTPGCPSANQVTAVRIISRSMAAGEYGLFRIELITEDNDGEDVYTNNWQADATNLELNVRSSDVSAITPSCINAGNLVFDDLNKNGRYDQGDAPIQNIDIELMLPGSDAQAGTSDDVVYKTTSSGSDGRWLVACIPPGEYFVRLASSNFEADGPLVGYQAAPDGSSLPNDDQDESSSHDLLDLAGQYRTELFSLDYATGPTGEAGDHIGTDINDNLTIDLGVVLGASTTEESPPPSTDTSTPAQPAAKDLGITGVQAITGLLLASLIVSSVGIRFLSKSHQKYIVKR